MADDIRPFLTTLASSTAVRAFAQALPVQATTERQSPWSPQPASQVAQQAIDVEAIKQKAIDDGRAAVQREMDAQRAKLTSLVESLSATRDREAERIAELVASAAATVISAWLDTTTDRASLFAPIVRGWLTKTGDGDGSVARVHPSEVAAMREAVGNALIAVEADPSIKLGDVHLRSPMLDLTHSWADRLTELSSAIATALRSDV